MGIRSWLGNKLFNIDKIVDRKMGERMQLVDSKQADALLVYRQKENAVWASGSADKLLSFYKTNQKPVMYGADRFLFWNWIGGHNSPKMHYPAAGSLLNAIKSLIFGEEPTIEFVTTEDNLRATYETLNDRLWKIFNDNKINDIYQKAAELESYSGGVAFKINLDKEVSKYPIIEVYPQERIELRTKYGRVIEIVFIDKYIKDKEVYTLKSVHGIGYIDYELYNGQFKEVPLTALEETKDLTYQEFPKKVLTAVYKRNRTSNEDKDSPYGGSDFDGVIDLFHQIDEVFSTMGLYIRRSSPITAINETQLKTSPDGSKHVVPKEWENNVMVLKKDMDANNVKELIYRDIPNLILDPYMDSILRLQGAIFQRVGLDKTSTNLEGVGANQSGEALMQREKSTVILYQNKVKGWQEALRELILLLLMFEDYADNPKSVGDYEQYDLNVGFPDYQSASFQDKIDMFTKAYTGLAVDLETMVKKIWEEDLEYEQIEEMVANIKVQNGIPMLGDDKYFPISIAPETDEV